MIATTLLGLAIWGQPPLLNTRLSVADASFAAHAIVVAVPGPHHIESWNGASGFGITDLFVKQVLKGPPREQWWNDLGASLDDGGALPRDMKQYVYFIARRDGHDRIIKVAPDDAATHAAVPRPYPPRILPGSQISIAAATAQADTIVVAAVHLNAMFGAGGFHAGTTKLQTTITLKGSGLSPTELDLVGITGGDVDFGRTFIVFITTTPNLRYPGRLDHRIVKLLNDSPANRAAVQAATGSQSTPAGG